MRLNREDKVVISFTTDIIDNDDWLPWSEWKDLRRPSDMDQPDIEYIPDTMGIYELAVKGNNEKVVYLGSSITLRQRLKTYRTSGPGNHKNMEIKNILDNGMTLRARYRATKQTELNENPDPIENPIQIGGEAAKLFKSEIAENMLLDKYNYFWNVRRNRRQIEFEGLVI